VGANHSALDTNVIVNFRVKMLALHLCVQDQNKTAERVSNLSASSFQEHRKELFCCADGSYSENFNGKKLLSGRYRKCTGAD